MNLQPGEMFPIVKVLNDPLDTSTYYLRAVVKKSSDGSTIDTVDLTDEGSRRFEKDWQVTGDIGANGSYIDITITVYTDSGYTTVSSNYEEDNRMHLVQERLVRTDMAFGGGADINYRKIKKIVRDEIDKIEKPKIPKINLKVIEDNLRGIQSLIENIVIPEQEKIDFGEVLENIKLTKEAIDNKHIPEPEKINLEPVVVNNTNDNKETLNEVRKMLSVLEGMIKDGGAKTEEYIGGLNKKMDLTAKMRKMFKESEDEFSSPEPKPKKKRFYNQ